MYLHNDFKKHVVEPILNLKDLDEMTDHERGEYDAIHGHDVKDNESPDYYSGYDSEYFAGSSDEERGSIDCKLGFPHKAGQSLKYDVGYAEQYEKDEAAGGRSNDSI